MEFRVLGPLEVVDGSADATPSAAKVRAVLAMLLLRHNQTVSTREFIDELWSEHPPPSALATLHTYIYKLRKVLARADLTALVTKPHGYLLGLPPERIDLYRFDRMVGEGRTALDRDDPARAARVLSAALALWRGPALTNLTAGELLSAQIARMEESRLRALDLRLSADLRLGRHRELISELKALIATHPLNEDFYAKLMTALHQSGRRYEALDVYQSLRHALIEQLGLEPSPSLRLLQQRLLSADPHGDSESWPGLELGLDLGSGHASGHPVGPGPGRAAEHGRVGSGGQPGEHSGPGSTAPPDRRSEVRAEVFARPVDAAPAQLPPDIPDFVGRRAAVEQIIAELTDAGRSGTAVPVICVSGMPGVGKTALALHAAHQLRAAFPDGQLYAELGGSGPAEADPGEVLDGFLRAVGVLPDRIPVDRHERSKLFRTWCGDRRVLIVLDDAAGAGQVQPLLPGSGGCAVLVTGRTGLYGFAGARTLRLAPLGRDESVELLSRIAGAARVESELQAAEQIVRHCGRLPLALRIVGAQLAASHGLALRRLAARLADPRARLDELSVGELDVRSAVDAAYRRLGAPERSVLRLLSLLQTPSIPVRQAAALLGYEVDRVERLLARLVDASLLAGEPGPAGEPRYTLHELVRLYARERLEEELTVEPDGDTDGGHSGVLGDGGDDGGVVAEEEIGAARDADGRGGSVPDNGRSRADLSPINR